MKAQIGIVGDFDPQKPIHLATSEAIQHAAQSLNESSEFEWLPTDAAEQANLSAYHGFWMAPGSPYRSLSGALRTIRYAREEKVPLLGTCGGFQHVILEFARNVLGIADAAHAESDPYASRLVISKLACSLVGRSLPIKLSEGSLVASLYGTTLVVEQYYCNFGVNPDYVSELASRDLRIVGSDEEGEIRVVELKDHPFFVGTLFVPQMRSRPRKPHPLVRGFLAAVFKAALV
jgi:CTP synthase (UTP-ammonia lyase)